MGRNEILWVYILGSIWWLMTPGQTSTLICIIHVDVRRSSRDHIYKNSGTVSLGPEGPVVKQSRLSSLWNALSPLPLKIHSRSHGANPFHVSITSLINSVSPNPDLDALASVQCTIIIPLGSFRKRRDQCTMDCLDSIGMKPFLSQQY